MNDAIREAFENWALRKNWGIDRDETGEYYMCVQSAWDAWQAALQSGEPVINDWTHFSFDTLPPPDVPLLVKLAGETGIYAAMFHTSSIDQDFDFWFSMPSHSNANLSSPDVYDVTDCCVTEWMLLPVGGYTTPQPITTKPIAAVKGWFHGECVIQALDPSAVLPAGMALYAAPQPVVPEVRVLNRDEARLALWRAIQEVVAGNKTDDKLIFENLRKAGVWLCRVSAGKGDES